MTRMANKPAELCFEAFETFLNWGAGVVQQC